MCTAISMRGERHLFGRTLDLETGFGEQVVITPSGYSFGSFKTKHRIIGVAAVRDGIPLYFDAMNERGLCAAALNFPEFAFYNSPKNGMLNIPSFNILPYVLGNCGDLEEARELLSRVNVTDTPFSHTLPPTPLHWLIADRKSTICAEPEKNGLAIHDDPFGVMTNSPPFSYQSLRVNDFSCLSPTPPTNKICPSVELSPYSRGLGAVGLPGDYSSTSRFIRALFALEHTLNENSQVSAFFHIMDTVAVPSGTVIAESGKAVRSIYTCCADSDSMTYYFTTYGCRRIQAVRLAEICDDIVCFSMTNSEDFNNLN